MRTLADRITFWLVFGRRLWSSIGGHAFVFMLLIPNACFPPSDGEIWGDMLELLF
jgi:hypothetical protein